jgi:hypothetical protein
MRCDAAACWRSKRSMFIHPFDRLSLWSVSRPWCEILAAVEQHRRPLYIFSLKTHACCCMLTSCRWFFASSISIFSSVRVPFCFYISPSKQKENNGSFSESASFDSWPFFGFLGVRCVRHVSVSFTISALMTPHLSYRAPAPHPQILSWDDYSFIVRQCTCSRYGS